MDEQWIRTMAGTHMDAEEAIEQLPRLVHLAVTLARAGGSIADEVRRLQAIEQRALKLAQAEGDHVRPTDRQTAREILGWPQ